MFGHLVVLNGGKRRAQFVTLIVEIGLRRGRQHMHIDARHIHVFQPSRNVEAAGRKRAIDGSDHVERRIVRVVRRDGHLGAGLGQQGGGFLGQDVGMGIDGTQLGHFVP